MLDNYSEHLVPHCISGSVNDWAPLDSEKRDENKSGLDSSPEKYLNIMIKKLRDLNKHFLFVHIKIM